MAQPPFEQQVFGLIKVAQAEGWTDDLIAALSEQRARNVLIYNLPDALRMATSEAEPRVVASGMTLERIVRDAGFNDLRPWIEKLSVIGQATCRIEFPVNGRTEFGTGFLVADDLVLTNFHVVEDHISGKRKPADIRCRFDYARDARGVEQGRQVSLAEGADWIVAHSPYDPADLSGTGVPAADHLDFALLRLAEAVGSQQVAGGARRGTVGVSSSAGVPSATAPVFIVQHPEGRPMAMAIGIMQENVKRTDVRLRYDTDTLPGSSGSGVFDQRLDLFALHHAGDPSSKMQALYNEGIPVGKIVGQLAAAGVAPFWK